MNRREYLDKRKEIQKRYEEDLDALDKVFAMFGGTPVGGDSSDSSPLRPNGWDFNTSKRETVRLAVSKIPQSTFTTRDVRNALNRDYPEQSKHIEDNQISAIVSWLASKGEIRVQTRKYGASPAIYEKRSHVEENLKAKTG